MRKDFLSDLKKFVSDINDEVAMQTGIKLPQQAPIRGENFELPSFTPTPLDSKVRDHAQKARLMSRVKTGLPKVLNPLFRSQGPINTELILGIEALSTHLESTNTVLGKNQESIFLALTSLSQRLVNLEKGREDTIVALQQIDERLNRVGGHINNVLKTQLDTGLKFTNEINALSNSLKKSEIALSNQKIIIEELDTNRQFAETSINDKLAIITNKVEGANSSIATRLNEIHQVFYKLFNVRSLQDQKVDDHALNLGELLANVNDIKICLSALEHLRKEISKHFHNDNMTTESCLMEVAHLLGKVDEINTHNKQATKLISFHGDYAKNNNEKTWYPQSFYLGNDIVVASTANNYRIALHSKDAGITPTILFSGMWEPGLTEVLKRIVKPGMHCLDVGAHVGYFTLLFASLVGDNGRVYSFEPNPRSYDTLIYNIRQNNYGHRVEPLRQALGDKRDKALLKTFITNEGSCTLGNYPQELTREMHEVPTDIEVDTTTLDEMESTFTDKISIVKMDCEGFEVAVLRGGSNLFINRLHNDALVFIEINPPALQGSGESLESIFLIIKQMGFKLYRREDESLVLVNSHSELDPWCITDCVLSKNMNLTFI